MSGENEWPVSGWTVDTLYQHLLERSELLTSAFRQQILDQRDAASRQMEDLRAAIAERLTDMRANLDERSAAQQTAVSNALQAAEKAVDKAEAAADKRFESVNEFRQQLTDQTATFPTRDEVDSKLAALIARLDESTRRIADLELRLTSRLDTAQGSRAGGRESRVEYQAETAGRQASHGQIMQFAGLVLLAIAIVASVLVAVFEG
jgi:chromosome segregation ATPase